MVTNQLFYISHFTLKQTFSTDCRLDYVPVPGKLLNRIFLFFITMLLSTTLLCGALQIHDCTNKTKQNNICSFTWQIMKHVSMNWWWRKVYSWVDASFIPLSVRTLTCEWPCAIHFWQFKLSVTQNASGVIRAITGWGGEWCMRWGALSLPLEPITTLHYTLGTTASSEGY